MSYIVEAIREVLEGLSNWICVHLRAMASFLQLLASYLVLAVVLDVETLTNEIWAVLIALPIGAFVISSYLRWYADKTGKGSAAPVPRERFTVVDDEDGLVTVEEDRIPEMLLYLADVEDWLERRGLM